MLFRSDIEKASSYAAALKFRAWGGQTAAVDFFAKHPEIDALTKPLEERLGAELMPVLTALNNDMAEWFCKYAEICFERFGDRVKIWATVNEPHFYSYCVNMLGNYPPNRSLDVQSYMQFQYNLMRTSALAVRTYRQMGYDGIIGAVHDGGVVELDPATEHPDDVFRYADFFANRMILAPALQGQLPPEMDEILEKLGVSLYRLSPRPFRHHLYCESAPPPTRPNIAVRHRH